ncbi:MAG: DUF368 domain-containing protein [Myxococcota bacterium]
MKNARTPLQYLSVTLKGAAMGAADVVPGVSGGTIAFITGIYEELLNAIRAFGGSGLRRLLAFDLKGFWREVNGPFLLALGAGIVLSVATLSRVVLYALENFTELLWAFFVGLLVGAIAVVGRQIWVWNLGTVVSGVVGVAAAYAIVSIAPAETPETLPFIFFSGMIAICAMILPGISGSFLLVVMGKYEFILGAVKSLQLDVLAAFAAGCGVGLLGFAHALSWCFRRFHDATVALVTGFLIGSMPKLWPWKHTLETYVDRHGVSKPLVQENVSPFRYSELTGADPQLLLAVVVAVLGLVAVVGLDRLGRPKTEISD